MNWLSKLLYKINPFKGKPTYVNYPMGNNSVTSEQEKLIAKNKNLLLDNKVPIGKIRFVFQSIFTYDVDKNIINPRYDIILPVDVNKKLVKNAPVIEVNKPQNMILVGVDNYSVGDNYALIKSMLKGNKRGLVIFLEDERIDGFKSPYYGVDTEILRIANLDEVVGQYKCQDLI